MLCAALDGLRLPSFPQVGQQQSWRTVCRVGKQANAGSQARHTQQHLRLCCIQLLLTTPAAQLRSAAVIPQHTVSVKYATEHRCGVVVRGPGLSDQIGGTDPLKDNLPLLVSAGWLMVPCNTEAVQALPGSLGFGISLPLPHAAMRWLVLSHMLTAS